MKCVIPGRNLKVFGRSIQCLSKVGDELYFEALQDGLAMRTVSSSRSAYACFLLKNKFFQEYSQYGNGRVSDSVEDYSKIKLSIRSCLSIFKSLATIDKVVDRCVVELKHDECRFVFVMFCKHGVTKTHNLTYQESESLQATFSKELCPNQFTAVPKLMLDSVVNFSCEEISLEVCPGRFKIRNYVECDPEPSKVMQTEMILAPEEFENYQVGVDTQVTFCLKELRAILGFSEFVNQPVRVYFETGGKPIVFSLDCDDAFCADFVMATLSENSVGESQQSIQTDSERVNVSRNGSQTRAGERKGTKTAPDNYGQGNGEVAVNTSVDLARDQRQSQGPDENRVPVVSSGEASFSASLPYVKGMSNKTSESRLDKTVDMISMSRTSKAISTPVSTRDSILMARDVDMPAVGDVSSDANSVLDFLLASAPPAKKFRSSFFSSPPPSTTGPVQNLVLLASDTDDED